MIFTTNLRRATSLAKASTTPRHTRYHLLCYMFEQTFCSRNNVVKWIKTWYRSEIRVAGCRLCTLSLSGALFKAAVIGWQYWCFQVIVYFSRFSYRNEVVGRATWMPRPPHSVLFLEYNRSLYYLYKYGSSLHIVRRNEIYGRDWPERAYCIEKTGLVHWRWPAWILRCVKYEFFIRLGSMIAVFDKRVPCGCYPTVSKWCTSQRNHRCVMYTRRLF